MTSPTTMPRLGMGTWELAGPDAPSTVQTAIGLGYRHIDTAQMYGNEEAVGRGIAASGIDRDELWVTTKLGNDNHAPADVVSSTEASIDRLGVGHLDLLLIHWPVEFDIVEQTLEAMQSLVDRDLVRHLGVSNFTARQVERAAEVVPITTDQVEYHALLDQTAVLKAVRAIDAVLTAYSPLGRGELIDHPVLTTIGGARDMSASQVALRWLLDQDDVVVIPKASSREHLEANLAVLDMPPLEPEDAAAVDRLPKDERILDPPFAPDWD